MAHGPAMTVMVPGPIWVLPTGMMESSRVEFLVDQFVGLGYGHYLVNTFADFDVAALEPGLIAYHATIVTWDPLEGGPAGPWIQ